MEGIYCREFEGFMTMPDGPRYDHDFYAWTQYQAEVLRTMRPADSRLDRETLPRRSRIGARANGTRFTARSVEYSNTSSS